MAKRIFFAESWHVNLPVSATRKAMCQKHTAFILICLRPGLFGRVDVENLDVEYKGLVGADGVACSVETVGLVSGDYNGHLATLAKHGEGFLETGHETVGAHCAYVVLVGVEHFTVDVLAGVLNLNVIGGVTLGSVPGLSIL